jgi:hypothetical protein
MDCQSKQGRFYMPQFAHGTCVFVGDGQKALSLINEGYAMVVKTRPTLTLVHAID